MATRCHVVLTANDMPGGSESDQAAFVTERFACAVSVAPAIAEQGATSQKIARYLEYLAGAFGTAAPMLSAAAMKALDAYRWPRNYLQLREVSERLYILVGAGTVDRAVAEEVLAQEDVIKTATFGAPTLESDLYILRPLADTERDIAHLWGRKRVVGSKLKHDGTLGYISRGAARRSGLNPAGWHRYVPIAVVVAAIVIALAALGYAGGGANLDAMFKSPELAHAGTEIVEGAQTQTGVAPQRGIVAAASTIADAQKDDGEQGDGAETTHTNETTTTATSI